MQQEKDKAVRDEDFDLAKNIKDTINRLQSIGHELTKLEQQKRQAINNEDFDTAKQLKMQIEQLKASAFNPDGPKHSQQPTMYSQMGSQLPPMHSTAQSLNSGPFGLAPQLPIAQQMGNMNITSQSDRPSLMQAPHPQNPSQRNSVFGQGPSAINHFDQENEEEQ